MTDQQQDRVPEAAEAKAEHAKSALAEAVAKRNEERQQNNKRHGGGAHGGKPMASAKVSAQVRGKL